ncbi:hypothetical protein ACXX83_07330 [Pseudomonas sp. GNP012]
MLFQPMKKALHAIPGNTDNAIPVGASLLAMASDAPRLSSSPALSLTTIAGKPAPTRDRAYAETVGASLLAMDSSAPRLSSSYAISLTTIAGKPAPTRDHAHAETPNKNGRPAGRPFFFISETFNTTNKVFAQCDGLGNPCTGKEPYTGRTESILVDENQYVRTAKMKFIDTMFKEMST